MNSTCNNSWKRKNTGQEEHPHKRAKVGKKKEKNPPTNHTRKREVVEK